ncbi:flavin-containing monooxygenase [Marinobacter subterrani]|uniref:Putative flavoprotein CzcO associated with the cation diffusion facilitator CzcD n=1 Tax=Marinobacter subterrani TaxID=1658765 RepID=A0A0J7J800_9GAMM|nr:NAD(P)/FAD-dependent oxidoreductase [Marinobacter subterrani]KMQ74327.1 putative flavoprotein CzcO associated with the cation diffusion facilitator CzcD [Marinobacter subterrani]
MTQNSSRKRPSILIIGTGFGGLGMAITLKQAGFTNLTMLEKAHRVGGTWRDNTYPGAACDVQSHFYSYSFEPRHDWSRKFGLQPEILGYMDHCLEKYQLGEHIRCNAEVKEASFDERNNQWIVTLTSGEQLTASVLITATGQLNQPAWPKLEGLDRFQGKLFHSARWDHDYDLAGKHVAVIGTGASAIQFVPEIAPKVKQLDLFQRSAAWVLPKPDRPFTAWEQAAFRKVPAWDRLYRYLIYWKNESRALAFTRFSGLLGIYANQAKCEAGRWVTDPAKLKHIIPDYKIGCKRILISNDWYPAINRPNVNLITDPIDHIEEYGVVTRGGQHHPVDAIICGTGFRASDFLSPIRITGRSGKTLNEAWQNGAAAFKGITVSGFPNLFMLYGPNTNLAHNSILYMLESQFRYVLGCVETLEKYPGSAMDVRQDRQDRFGRVVQQRLKDTVWNSGCSSWYLDANGRNTINWPGFSFTYRFATRRVDTADYHFSQPSTTAL